MGLKPCSEGISASIFLCSSTAAVVASLNVLRNVWLVRGSIFGVGLQIGRDPKHARASRDRVSGERKGAFVK